jgi:TolA-binding protein
MKRQLLKISSVLFVVILFSLMSGVALAQKKHWFVVKDNNGMCKVIEAQAISGPFKTMEQAEKRKAKDCPKGSGQATEKLRPQQEQVEPMRRQHQQREEPQQQHLKQQQTPQQQQKLAPQQQQQTEKMKGKAQDKTEGSKPSEEKVKEKTTEPIPSEKKN